jgi:putative aldouronate transport system substrate-binding protein
MAAFTRICGTALVLCAAVFLPRCGISETKAARSQAGKETLRIAIQPNMFVTSYKDNYLTRYLEELHHINLEFELLPASEDARRSKIALMAASGDMPDIFLTGGLSEKEVLDYGGRGAFIALNKYFNDPALTPCFARIPRSDRETMLRTASGVDGGIYGFVRFEPEIWNITPYRYYINQAWLKRLGLETPATTAELRKVLLAFRERDPNGNGKRDEIGVMGWYDGIYGENTVLALINSFIYYSGGAGLNLDDAGKGEIPTVYAPFAAPAFRTALAYLNTLFNDGTLSPSLFTADQQSCRAVFNSAPPVVGLTSAGSTGSWSPDNLRELSLIAPFTGPDGICYSPAPGLNYRGVLIAYITSKAANPDLAVRLLDSFYDETLSLIARYGEENTDWSRKPEDQSGAGNLTELRNIWSSPAASHWHNINPRYMPPETIQLAPHSKRAANYQWYYPRHPPQVLPALQYSAEEAGGIAENAAGAESAAGIAAYVKQSIAEFAAGVRDISSNAEWNGYLEELNHLGLERRLRIVQTAFNRQWLEYKRTRD